MRRYNLDLLKGYRCEEAFGPEWQARRWTCSECGALYLFDQPEPSPIPCDACGGIAFECDDVEQRPH